MMEILPLLHWHYAGGLLAVVVLGLVLRGRGGPVLSRVGAVIVWLVIIAAAAWAGASLYDALMFFYR